MKSDFISAINQICSEKGLSKEVVLQAIEAALVSAYRRNFAPGGNQVVTVKIDPQTGQVRAFVQKNVVEEVQDKRAEAGLDEARRINPDAQLGDLVDVESTPYNFGRIAAQTAKQVVLQRLREAERELVFEEFVEREGDIVNGIVQRIEPKAIIIDLGKAEATLPSTEQVPSEHYRPGQRLKVYVIEVHRTNKGPQIIVSRTHRNLLRRLFELEVPEIYGGTVEIKAISREPGSRAKVAVAARQEGIDPVGSCVGLRGVRIQSIVSELGGEKIDVVQWHADSSIFVANALSPAQVLGVDINEADKTATVTVPERQLSLAIGKEGQNARLAARLTGWRIDIKAATNKLVEKSDLERLQITPSDEELARRLLQGTPSQDQGPSDAPVAGANESEVESTVEV
ncbi:MAG: transcription termination/antitermination protein NusA [Chloroflexi bacterium]|nr:transcription termination/antitermination protein NusA [Chloroflexota bacterium]